MFCISQICTFIHNNSEIFPRNLFIYLPLNEWVCIEQNFTFHVSLNLVLATPSPEYTILIRNTAPPQILQLYKEQDQLTNNSS